MSNPTKHVTSLNGDDFYFEVREAWDGSDAWVVREVIEEDCYRLHTMTGEHPSTILDIGSNVGAFAAYASRCWPDARIVAVEPNRENFDQLLINLDMNDATNVKAIHAAVWQHNDGVVVLGEAGLSAVWDGTDNLVPSTTLDALTADMESIDFLKIDVEGAEEKIVMAASDDTLSKIQYVIGEFHGLDETWGPWVRRLSGFLPLTIRAHNPPRQIFGGMFWGRKESEEAGRPT